MTLRRYTHGALDPAQHASLTPEEREAWLHTEPGSYHSYHIERMGEDTFNFRDSSTASYYIGTLAEVAEALSLLRLRKPDLNRREHLATPVRILSQAEVDDLLGDL